MRTVFALMALGCMLAPAAVPAAWCRDLEPTASRTEKPPKIMSMVPDGWTKSITERRGNGAYSYVMSPKGSPDIRVTVRAEPSRGRSPDALAATMAWNYGAYGMVVLNVETATEGRTIASATAVKNVPGGKVIVARFGIRRPKTRPDLLVTVLAAWTGDLTPELREEIDLIILSASAE